MTKLISFQKSADAISTGKALPCIGRTQTHLSAGLSSKLPRLNVYLNCLPSGMPCSYCNSTTSPSFIHCVWKSLQNWPLMAVISLLVSDQLPTMIGFRTFIPVPGRMLHRRQPALAKRLPNRYSILNNWIQYWRRRVTVGILSVDHLPLIDVLNAD